MSRGENGRCQALAVVAGSLGQGVRRGGHCWFFAQWLLGLRQLGWSVFFIDYEDAESPLSDSDRDRLGDVLRAFGLGDCYSVLTEHAATAGRSRQEALDTIRKSQVLVNVMGFLRDEELLEAAPLRVFLDIDPGYGQMWRELGLADVLAGHDRFVTLASNMGKRTCEIPAAGVEWTTIHPPIFLDRWEPTDGGDAYTSVATWRGPWGTVDYEGHTYGSRAHEFRKFASLPQHVEARCELALDIHADEVADRALLRHGGWRLVDPVEAAGDPRTYQRYIQGSRAEFCVAKNMYVDTRGGWLSDRSVCYLASGKPVLAQDTGFTETLPTGNGLIAFSTLDEAIAGLQEIETRYQHHAAAARELAEERFDSDIVLSGLLERIGVA